jgi:hypothetical protein
VWGRTLIRWTALVPVPAAVRQCEGEVLHFSEDPTITEFVPHVAASARVPDAYVCAVDAQRAPAYWFPRQCPRVLARPRASSASPDVARIFGPYGGSRVHAAAYAWLERMRSVRLYGYRFPAALFRPITEPEPARRFGEPEPSAHVAGVPVRPLGRRSARATSSRCMTRLALNSACCRS